MSNLKRIIIGIDPGLQVTGYGVIWSQGSKKGCITFGQIKTNATNSLNFRLCQIEQKLRDLILTHQTHEVSIEQVFTLRNHKAALKLGQARGAAIVATASCSLPISEYSACQIKQAVVGYGAATKSQVQHMVYLLLQLDKKPPVDAADALAIAICHANSYFLSKKLMQFKRTLL